MVTTDGLYTITMQGEKHKYELRGSEQHTLEVICAAISDLTGYKPEYLRDDRQLGIKYLRIGQERQIFPAAIGQMWGGTPSFVIKRVS